MPRYVAFMDDWRLVVDADSEEEAKEKALEDLKVRLRADQFIVWEDPKAHYVRPVDIQGTRHE